MYMDLEEALEQFDATDANLRRMTDTWEELRSLVPGDIVFVGASPEDRRYRELLFRYEQLRDAMPAISGFRITATPMGLDDIAHARFDVMEVGELSAQVSLDDEIERPGREIDRYRLLLAQARRRIVRERVGVLDGEIPALVRGLAQRVRPDQAQITDEAVEQLRAAFDELERLAGPLVPRNGPWSDLQRHLHFAEGHDLLDIAQRDWPKVRSALTRSLEEERDPLPVSVADLDHLARSGPSGRVTTRLDWSSLSADGFERVVYNLIADAPGYENPQWLTNTNAPDRGRDLSVDRVSRDELTGTLRQRVILQVKHRQATPVRVAEMQELVAQMALWEPPPVDVLVVVTSGRFVTDAVQWIEGHNRTGDHPRIEMWPESHVELLLSRRPDIAATAGLHRGSAPDPTPPTT